MILLENPPVLFLKPRKVAGTSFEIALSKYATGDSVITPISPEDEVTRKDLGYRTAQNYALSPFEVMKDRSQVLRAIYHRSRLPKYFNHITASRARSLLGGAWHKSLKVSIVRNPFDQLISLYHWKNKDVAEPMRFQDWISLNPSFLNLNYAQTHIDGECVIDFFIRYEAFEDDIIALEHRLPELSGLWDTFSTLSAKAGIRPKEDPPSSYFADAPQLVEAIKFFNADIIDRFGYDLN